MTREELERILSDRENRLIEALSTRFGQVQEAINQLHEADQALTGARWIILHLLEDLATGELTLPTTLDAFRERGRALGMNYEKAQKEILQKRVQDAASGASLIEVVEGSQQGPVDVGI